MNSLSADLIETIQDMGENLAGSDLSFETARLYSHHTQIREGVAGLSSWNKNETLSRLRDAERLLEAGLLLSDSLPDKAKRYLRRAAEIFEWVDTLPDKPSGIPYIFFTAASYQLAGYSARALGAINSKDLQEDYSKSLAFFLRGNFIGLQQSILEGLIKLEEQYTIVNAEQVKISIKLAETVLRCFGIFCAWLRWGDENRLDASSQELKAVSKAMLYGQDTYSWLLSKLITKISEENITISLRRVIQPFEKILSESGKKVVQGYIRQSFYENRSLTWPSQLEGINQLVSGKSFALCTPTGSGKTRIAELAILQGLFSSDSTEQSKIVLYLVPSRALAAEVENTISQVFRGLKINDVTVTSMYGGNDWGPSDALVNLENACVIISTHEKAEALLRFAGTEFIHRICCLVLDEAHTVAFDNDYDALRDSNSRALHLETLVSRLFSFFDRDKVRVIALSAVATNIETNLAQWVSNQNDATAISTQYRSTRQLVGRLLCSNSGSARIEYDLLDGQILNIAGTKKNDRPYVPHPFPKHPPIGKTIPETKSDEVKMRAHLLWAAIHMAAQKGDSKNFHPVLISITANPGFFAQTFIDLLEKDWVNKELPVFFINPINPPDKELYENCLITCSDYFGQKSREYRLLKHGIVLHHGKMPQIMSGFLVQLIKKNIVNIVLATSTLSEGVNLPFETVLLPTLVRHPNIMSVKEFSNLIGRAGRPGTSTEGRSLVLINPSSTGYNMRQSSDGYNEIIKELSSVSIVGKEDRPSRSAGPLSELISYIFSKWSVEAKSKKISEFISWLETAQGSSDDANLALDSLDGVLLSSIHEFEEISDDQINMDVYLGNLWKQTFSSYATNHENVYMSIFKARGNALVQNIYPEQKLRKALYNTSLPPRDGKLILENLDVLTILLQDGLGYVEWDNRERFDYLMRLIEAVRVIPSFAFFDEKNITIKELLAWWLWPNENAKKRPKPASISKWYSLGAKKFSYLFNWGIGSLIGTILNQEKLSGTTMERWQSAGLPWSIIWIKDLISWGVFDPVAAFLLSQKLILTRQEATEIAKEYWSQADLDEGDRLLDPRKVQKWFRKDIASKKIASFGYADVSIPIKPLVDINNLPSTTWRVLPVVSENSIKWYDVAGYPLAKSNIPKKWEKLSIKNCDYILHTMKNIVVASFV